MRRLLSSDKSDCWILNTAFTVDEFSFVVSYYQLVGLYSQVILSAVKLHAHAQYIHARGDL